ncbi:YbjN domain-containing protein [Sphingomonas sp. HF-S3]|uniref:YbjN domain-containing protein n=1 Tax=Sphingomonas rustica TaxID=3103142 RepID=A0ABV0BDJ1_9SPHN
MTAFRTAFAALAFIAGSALSLPAAAQMVRGQNPQSVLAAMKAGGYSGATLSTDKGGDPMINAETNDTKFAVFFYNCKDNKDCATVQFYTAYKAEKPIALERINEWNNSRRFGRASLDKDNDPVIRMDVDLDDGGMPQALFIDNLEFWESVVVGFEKHIAS